MRCLSILVLLFAVTAVGCGDDDAPVAPKIVSYDGYYEVSYVLVHHTCSIMPGTPPEKITIDIHDGNEITFGGLEGSWDKNTKQAICYFETECSTVGSCTFCSVGGINVVFTDSSHFAGELVMGFDFLAGCTTPDCGTRWAMTGQKVASSTTVVDRLSQWGAAEWRAIKSMYK